MIPKSLMAVTILNTIFIVLVAFCDCCVSEKKAMKPSYLLLILFFHNRSVLLRGGTDVKAFFSIQWN